MCSFLLWTIYRFYMMGLSYIKKSYIIKIYLERIDVSLANECNILEFAPWQLIMNAKYVNYVQIIQKQKHQKEPWGISLIVISHCVYIMPCKKTWLVTTLVALSYIPYNKTILKYIGIHGYTKVFACYNYQYIILKIHALLMTRSDFTLSDNIIDLR